MSWLGSPRLRVVLLAVLIPLAAYVLWRFPWVATANVVARADVGLLVIALFANLTAIFAKGWAWSLLLQAVGRHRFRTAQEANLIGAAVNNLSVSVVGEVERVRYLAAAEGLPAGRVAVSVVWARAVEGAALALMLAAACALLDFH